MIIEHLGKSGLSLDIAGARLAIDPPYSLTDPVVVTWSEAERVAGLDNASSVAGDPALLAWKGIPGSALLAGVPVEFAGFKICGTAFQPIPYATPLEAFRKTRSALRSPLLAASRLYHTLGRPGAPPLTLSIERRGVRVAYLHQALHRFLPVAERLALIEAHRGADVLIAGTDFDDEVATGQLMHLFEAKQCVVADLIGPIRRRLELPTRPLSVTLDAAPVGTIPLGEHQRVTLEGIGNISRVPSLNEAHPGA
jgi:hypothetical protein